MKDEIRKMSDEELKTVEKNSWGVHISGFKKGCWWRLVSLDGDYVNLITNTTGKTLRIHKSRLLTTKTTDWKLRQGYVERHKISNP